jgi:dephospho-CoA kinase
MTSQTEIIFLVEQDPEGGYIAKALSAAIFTEAEDLETLKIMVEDAVNCHFDSSQVLRNKIILIDFHYIFIANTLARDLAQN